MKPIVTRADFLEAIKYAQETGHKTRFHDKGVAIDLAIDHLKRITVKIRNISAEPGTMKPIWSSIMAAWPYRIEKENTKYEFELGDLGDRKTIYPLRNDFATLITFSPPYIPKKSPGPKNQGLVSFHLLIPIQIAEYLKELRQAGIPTNQVINDAIAFWLQSNTHRFNQVRVNEILKNVKSFL